MIIIYINSMTDTDTFKDIYKDVECRALLINPTRKEAVEALNKWRNDTVLCFGHGTENGLLNANLNGYIIDDKNFYLLNGREVICIWCNADKFALKHNLKGFFTSMFYSNMNEAICFVEENPKLITEDFLYDENRKFARQINTLLKDYVPLEDWLTILIESADFSNKLVVYNYFGLCFIDEDGFIVYGDDMALWKELADINIIKEYKKENGDDDWDWDDEDDEETDK